MNITLRVVVILSVLIVIPESSALFLLESNRIDTLRSFLSIHLAVTIALIVPFSRLSSYLIIGRELSELSVFCRNIKDGKYNCAFVLPNEQEDETDILRLKRLLNWMAHSLSIKESTQRYHLGKNEELKNHFRNLSMQDELTRLFNRRYFNTQLRMLADTALKRSESLCLMLIDVDNFKQVNDARGHQVGDELLKGLAEILRCSVRSCADIPFRYGGDEFGIIFPEITVTDGSMVAERIRKRYAESMPEGTSLSIGMAFLPHTSPEPDIAVAELIKAADDSVYAAKKNGRNGVVLSAQAKVTPRLPAAATATACSG